VSRALSVLIFPIQSANGSSLRTYRTSERAIANNLRAPILKKAKAEYASCSERTQAAGVEVLLAAL